MCFRPAGASASINCPECGMKINEVLGQLPDECPFCEEDISGYIQELRESMEADIATAAPESAFVNPTTPPAPGTPPAPSAPAAPPMA